MEMNSSGHVLLQRCIKYSAFKYKYKYSSLKYKYKYSHLKYKYFKLVLKYKYQVLQVCAVDLVL